MSWYGWRLRRKCYEGIDDMPIKRWWAIHEFKDYTHLVRVRRGSYNRYQKAALYGLWERIWSQYIERFGFSKDFQATLEKEKEIALLINEKIQSGDKTLQTIIEVAQQELEAMKSTTSGKSDFWEYNASIERVLQRNLDPETITVARFFSIVNELKKRKPTVTKKG